MFASEPQSTVASNRRLLTQAKLPAPEVLRMLAPAEVKRLKHLLASVVEYIPHERLDAPDAHRLLEEPLPEPVPANADDSGVHPLDAEQAASLKLDRERQLFLRLNYCRRRLHDLLQHFAGRRLSVETVHELLDWDHKVHQLRSMIVAENVALVMAMAKRTRIVGVDASDLLSEGNLALLRAVMKFDCSRGYRFSTYACRAILKSFSRVATRATRHRGHFPTEFDPSLEKGNFVQRRRLELEEACVDELRSMLDENDGYLSDVERQVIRARFALDGDGRPDEQRGKTLEQVGELIGLTKERVRQIQNKALSKLRVALDQQVLAS